MLSIDEVISRERNLAEIYRNDIVPKNETDTEIMYVIAQFEKSKWWHYIDFPNVDDAKECLDKVRKKYPDIKFGLFEKIQKTTMNMLDEEFI